jgi:SAM-dependent methyltransferase
MGYAGATERYDGPSQFEYPPLSRAELNELADAIERRGLQEGLAPLDEHPNRQAVLADLFDLRNEGWIHLVADRIGGECLDLYSGFGKRAEMLAELSEGVHAVDQDPAKLRIASARSGSTRGSAVTPVRADLDALPFSARSFETIVADFAGGLADDDHALRDRITTLRRLLVEDGTLLAVLDGSIHQTGLVRSSGLLPVSSNGHASTVDALREGLRSSASGYRRLLRDSGFGGIDLCALLPAQDDVGLAFRVDDRNATEWVIDRHLSPKAALLATATHRLGVLEQLYPNYLAVCTNGSSESTRTTGFTDGRVVIPGYGRSIVLDVSSNRVETARKVPNSTTYAETTARENRILEALSAAKHPITRTLPSGTAGRSVFGESRIETPVRGRPLADLIEPTPEAFRTVLTIGLDWLSRFQGAFRAGTVLKSPAEVRSDLRYDRLPVRTPPEPTEPIELFVTPSHGDLNPWNLFVDGTTITSVLDWEYATLRGNPVGDVGMLVLNLCAHAFEDFEQGLQAVFERETPYSAAFEEAIGRYCDAVDLAPRAIDNYLPYACTQALDQWPYAPWEPKFLDWIRLLEEFSESVSDRFTAVDSDSA